MRRIKPNQIRRRKRRILRRLEQSSPSDRGKPMLQVDIDALQDAIDEVRLGAWKTQDAEFFAEATIEMDGTIVETTGQCKLGMDMSYKGIWGYHPLVLTLAETGEVLRIKNRSGIRLEGELVTEIRYQPDACERAYRLVIIRKNLRRNDNQGRFFDDYRYFFYLTNDWGLKTEEVVYGSNDRCNQENILAQMN